MNLAVTSSNVAAASDLLTLFALATLWLAFDRSRRTAVSRLVIAALLMLVVAWAAAWTWYQPLAAMRLAPPPLGQASAILAVVLSGSLLLISAPVRGYLAALDHRHLLWVGPWRIVFGALLLVQGGLGALPASFYVSAGIGDILVGLLALPLLARRSDVSPRALAAWNLVGLADLIHVLLLGAIHLRPFFLANPDVPTLNLVPLAGVPVFIVAHLLTLWALSRQWRAGSNIDMRAHNSSRIS